MPIRPLRALLSGALLVAAGLAWAPPAGAAETVKKTVSGTYPLASGGRIELENVNGAVRIETWDRDEVEVHAEKVVKASSAEVARQELDRLKVFVDAKPGRVKVQGRYPRHSDGVFSWLSGRHADRRIEFRLKIPREADVHVETVNGQVKLAGGRGDLHLETVNGNLSVSDAQGKLHLESINGAIDVQRSGGELQASTINGAIEAGLVELGPGKTSLSSTNGGITLRLPRATGATVDAATTNGRVACELPFDGVKKRTRLEGNLNGGGPTIELDTTNGSIEIVEM